MRTTVRQAVLVGFVVAGVTWLSQLGSKTNNVSVFPDVISLVIFVLLTAVALRKFSPPFADWGEVLKTASGFGAASGAVVALSVGLRVMMTWQRPAPLKHPDDFLPEAVVVVASWLVVLLLTNVVALLACRPERESQRSAA